MKRMFLLSVVAALFLVACSPGEVRQAAEDLQDQDVQWSCVRYECTEYGTGIEWAEQNCRTTPNGTVCPVTQNGQQLAVPLSRLNLTAITESQSYCKQYACVEEAPTRVTNYTVNRSEVQGIGGNQRPASEARRTQAR